MIYDCFTLFNELDLLEIRMKLLDRYVDKFVIAESTRTHSGKPKELNFLNNKSRFSAFENKIIYVIVDDFPKYETSWTYENYQRNELVKGIVGCKPDDIILISDLDEIPNLERLPNLIEDGKVYCFLQDLYFYFVNNININHLVWEGGTKAITYRTIAEDLLNERFVRYNQITFPAQLNKNSTLTKVRLYRNLKFVNNGGWHFSYLGGVEAIVKKLDASSHQENNIPSINSDEYIASCLSLGVDVLNSTAKLYQVSLATFPTELKVLFPPNFILEHKNLCGYIRYKILKKLEIFKIYLRNYYRAIVSK